MTDYIWIKDRMVRIEPDKYYISQRPGFIYRPNSQRQVKAVNECNRLFSQIAELMRKLEGVTSAYEAEKKLTATLRLQILRQDNA